MNSIFYKKAKEVKKALIEKRIKSMASLKDIAIVLTYIDSKKAEDFEKVKVTKLYNKHSGEYCQLLELVY